MERVKLTAPGSTDATLEGLALSVGGTEVELALGFSPRGCRRLRISASFWRQAAISASRRLRSIFSPIVFCPYRDGYCSLVCLAE